MSASKKFPIPLSYFSIALGLFALGLSWRYGASVGLLPALAAESLLAAASVVWLLLVAAYLIKMFAYRNDFLSDLRDLVQCCFISAIPITAMLEGLALKPYQADAAAVLIYAGVAGQLAFSMYRAAGLWRGLHSLEATTPIIYLPTVATNFVSASSLAALGHHDYAALFFGAGMFSWLSLEASILGRLRTAAPVGTAARGVVGIQLAPAFVGCGAYFAVGGKIDGFALALIGYGCLQLLFLLRLTRWFWEGGFTMSFWGFSFGFAAMAGCGLHLAASGVLSGLGLTLAAAGSAGVALLLACTLHRIATGRFLVRG